LTALKFKLERNSLEIICVTYHSSDRCWNMAM